MFIKIHERRQGGFTLVELIIVLAIIGILTALAISRISYNRTRAAKTTCNGIMGDIKKACEAYYADTGSKVSNPSGLITQGYMAGTPKQPHGIATAGSYAVDWQSGTTGFNAGSGTAETARVQCPWSDTTLSTPAQAVFPDGHTM